MNPQLKLLYYITFIPYLYYYFAIIFIITWLVISYLFTSHCWNRKNRKIEKLSDKLSDNRYNGNCFKPWHFIIQILSSHSWRNVSHANFWLNELFCSIISCVIYVEIPVSLCMISINASWYYGIFIRKVAISKPLTDQWLSYDRYLSDKMGIMAALCIKVVENAYQLILHWHRFVYEAHRPHRQIRWWSRSPHNITTCQDVATWSFLNGFVCEPHRLLIDLIDFSYLNMISDLKSNNNRVNGLNHWCNVVEGPSRAALVQITSK